MSDIPNRLTEIEKEMLIDNSEGIEAKHTHQNSARDW